MSGRCTGWVLRHGPHPDDLDRDGVKYGQRARGYRAVLLTIADAANADGEHAHPGLAAMCAGALYSRRQVQNIERELVAERWVTITEDGGGRKRATVYTVNMDWRDDGGSAAERVQSLPDDDDGKGATVATETVQPDGQTVQSGDETVQPGVHPNGVSNGTSNGEPQPPPSGEEDPARALVVAFWEWCIANGKPTPTLAGRRDGSPFMALVKIVRHLLDAGWSGAEVKHALVGTRAYTTDAITFQLTERRRAGRQQARQVPAAEAWGDKSGEVEV